MKAVANLKSSVLEPKKYTTTTTRVHTSLPESSTEEVVLSDESQAYRWAELEEACQLTHFPNMVVACNDTC